MLAVYLAKLPEHGGPRSSTPSSSACYAATFYLAELVLSPVFGVLSDRLGPPPGDAVRAGLRGGRGDPHRRSRRTCCVLGGTRILEGASTAASVPSILGYIALVTAGNEVLRGKAAARFEGATLAGPRRRARRRAAAVRRARPGRVLPQRRRLRRLVPDLPLRRRGPRPASARARRAGRARRGLGRYVALLRTSHVWLLAPTWIAVNAAIGAVVQPVDLPVLEGRPEVPGPGPDAAASAPIQISLGGGRRRDRLRRRPDLLGQPLQDAAADDDHRLRRSSAAASWSSAASSINHARRPSSLVAVAGGHRGGRRAVRPRRRDPGRARPARRHVRALPDRPRRDHGPLLASSSRIGQIIGSLIGGVAADWRGIDGLLVATRRPARHRARAAGPAPRRQEHQLEPELRRAPARSRAVTPA